MKKRLTAILTIVLALTMLSACGKNSGTSTQEEITKPENSSTSAQGEFPKPVGSYTVGRTQMDFKYKASDNSERELTALFFYPSDSSEGKPTAEYAFPEFHSLRDELLVRLGATAGGEQLFDLQF